MKIAAFNVENLFDRAKAFNEPNKEVAKEILAAAAELNKLMEEDTYTEARKARMLELIEKLGLTRKDEGPFVRLRRIRGQFLRRPRDNSEVTIVASGRASWIGWLEHKTEQVNEVAIDNTGRVIRDVNADILAVVEAEGRVELSQFVEYVIGKAATEVDAAPEPYRHVMVIDGNDKRGIDVGLMTKRGFLIEEIRSHVDDVNGQAEAIFDRDCPEYEVRTPAGRRIWILPNHLKSKFGGDSPKTRERRKRQAERVAAIYNAIKQRGDSDVVVLGDFNDTLNSPTLAPLLASTDLKDVSTHPSFDTGEFAGRGTFGLGNDNQKIDYLLLSPSLFAKVQACGLFRKGAWPGRNPRRWTVYPQLTEEIHVASDHHLIWADLDIA